MKKNCIIIHGCPNNKEIPNVNEINWYAWLKKSLGKKGFEVQNPIMPSFWEPKYADWKSEFEKLTIDENTIIVAHSGGASFIVHWLGDTKRQIKKLILVAPAKIPGEGKNRMLDMYNFEVDPSIKERVKDIVVFVSNDKSRHVLSARMYASMLGAQFYEIKEKGHFSEADMGTNEFPELLKEVLKT